MRTSRNMALALVAMISTTIAASADSKTTTFAVVRNDTRIGTSTVHVEDIGPEKTVASATHVAVKLAFLTLYHFDQTETEEWAQGRWQSVSATTDDNGTLHRMLAANSQDGVVVHNNGTERRFSASVIPASLWNVAILTQSAALDPLDGRIVAVKVVDRGEDGVI